MPAYFDKNTIQFLKDLKANNDKAWFNDHKQDYEDKVRTPALAFIEAMEPWLKMISPHYEATPKKMGGSLMRVYRDVRFSKDKSPYKTNIGIQFRHEVGKNVHAPGFYFHIEPDDIFVGVGTWHPESDALRAIRQHIETKPGPYQDAIEHTPFTENFELVGDKLTRPPKGFEKEHPLIEEIKRKDFIGVAKLNEDTLFSQDICEQIARLYGTGQPLMRFLCEAFGLRF